MVLCGGLALLVFSTYWATLSRGVLGGDAGELQFVPPILGLPHPTGYPLQVLLHHVWSVVPIGSVAYRLNLFDAGIAAAAVGLVAACGLATGCRPTAAAGGALAFALGELWWSQAVRGDKYTLNGLFLALVLLLYFRWRAAPSDERRLRLLAIVYGLSLAHHRSMLLVAPALGLGLLLEGWRPRGWREPTILLLLIVAPLLLYLYVPWAGSRGLPPGSWRVDTPGAVIEFLLDRGYTSQIRPDAVLAGRLAEEAGVLLRSFGPLGVLLGLVGLTVGTRRGWRWNAVLVAAFAPQAVLGASYLLESNYALPRHWVFYLPAFLIWSLWLTIGLDALLSAVSHAARRRGPIAVGTVAAAMLALQGTTVWTRGAEAMVRAEIGAETLDGFRQDLQRSPLAERFGRLSLTLAEANAVLVCDWEQATVLWYLQQVEGQRRDVRIRYPIELLESALSDARGEGRPVYVARALPELSRYGLPSSVGPLLRVGPDAGTGPARPNLPIGARLEDGLSLLGVTYHATASRVGSVLPLTLFWSAERQLEHDNSVSIRLLATDGRVVAQHDERHPALGTSPTSRWPAGHVVGDYHELPIGNRLDPGTYRLHVVAYRPEPLRNLRRVGPGGELQDELIELPPIEVAPRPWSLWDLPARLRGA